MPFEKPQISSSEEKETKEEQKKTKKEILQEKKEALKELGFSSEKTIKYLAYYFKLETLKKKIEAMRKLGFEDPVRLIDEYPQLAGPKIERVIKSLKEAGFKNPVKLIERFPQLVTYDIERVKKRIELLDRLIRLYKLKKISGKKIGENFPQLFGFNIHRIYFYVRVLREMSKDTPLPSKKLFDKLFKKGKRLIYKNPYLIFYFLIKWKPKNFEELGKILMVIEKLSKSDKNQRIAQIKKELPNIIESLQKSLKENENPDPYDEFLLKLAQRLERLKKNKDKE